MWQVKYKYKSSVKQESFSFRLVILRKCKTSISLFSGSRLNYIEDSGKSQSIRKSASEELWWAQGQCKKVTTVKISEQQPYMQRIWLTDAEIAQLGERQIEDLKVPGSNPEGSHELGIIPGLGNLWLFFLFFYWKRVCHRFFWQWPVNPVFPKVVKEPNEVLITVADWSMLLDWGFYWPLTDFLFK